MSELLKRASPNNRLKSDALGRALAFAFSVSDGASEVGMRKQITAGEFRQLTAPLAGLRVSRPWRGYGSAIFLELGKLRREARTHRKGFSLKGQATVMIEWSWRVEGPRAVRFGSWSTDGRITRGLRQLTDQHVRGMDVIGRLPELVIELSQDLWLSSFSTVEGQPQWVVFLPNGGWLHTRLGRLELEHSERSRTKRSTRPRPRGRSGEHVGTRSGRGR